MTLAILADDLTGACDTGSLFAGPGAVPVTVWPATGAGARRPAIQVVDTESRRLTARDAAARIASVARACATPRYFKKIDSTFRGCIGAEVDALMTAAGTTRALVCPAFPAQRRTVVDGQLLVDDVPVHETGMQPTSDLVELLRAQLARPIARIPLADVRAGHDALADRVSRLEHTVIVADAVTDDDLDRLVDASLTLPAAPLLVGAAGLARALAARLGVLRERVALPRAQRWLVIAGSLHPATRRQIQAARDAGLAVIASAPGASDDGGAAARHVAGEARDRLRTERFDVVIVTGGETALALHEALGSGALEVVGPPAPGLALVRLCMPDGDDVWLVTKAGGFGDPDLFVTLAKAAA